MRLRNVHKKRKGSLTPGTEEWKDADRLSTALKVVANAFYGVIGSQNSRFYDKDLAEAVTLGGVFLIRETQKAAEAKGWRCIYIETDSLFITGCTVAEFGAFTKWCNEELYPRLLKECGCRENTIKLAYEKAFERLVFPVGDDGKHSSKRYAGSYLHYDGKPGTAESKPEIKGLEFKRGDTLRLARGLQARVIDMLVGGLKVNPGIAVPTDKLEDYYAVLAATREHLMGDELGLDDVQLLQGLSKPIDEYSVREKKDKTFTAPPIHVQVATMLRERREDVQVGTRIAYVVVDADATPMKAVPASDYDGACDRHYLWNDRVFAPSQRLLAGAFPGTDWSTWKVKREKAPRPEKDPRQVLLFAAAPLAGAANVPAMRRLGPLTIRMNEGNGANLRALHALLERYPGPRSVMLEIETEKGTAKLAIPHRVDATPELLAAVRALGIAAL